MAINKKTKKNFVREKAVKYTVEQDVEELDDETIEIIRQARRDIKAGLGTIIDPSIPGELERFHDLLEKQ
jgi:hypothetical protein